MRWIQYIFLVLSCWAVCFVAARSAMVNQQVVLPDEFDAKELKLEGQRLDWDVPKLSIKGLVQQLRDRYGADIRFDVGAVVSQGLFTETEVPESGAVSLQLRQATLAEAIWGICLLDDQGHPIPARLDFAVLGKTIVINRPNNDGRFGVLRAYDIKPLIAKLLPHQRRLQQLLPDPPVDRENSGGLFGPNRRLRTDEEIAAALEGMIYYIATDNAVIENGLATARSAGVVFAQMRLDQHQRVVQRLNQMHAELDRLNDLTPAPATTPTAVP